MHQRDRLRRQQLLTVKAPATQMHDREIRHVEHGRDSVPSRIMRRMIGKLVVDTDAAIFR